MEVWYGAEQVPASLSAPGGPGAVVTIGIFDGVHRGHQAVLGRVVELSRELAHGDRRPLAVAVTFDPHPRSVHQPEADLPLIASLTDRLASLKDLGLDAVLVQMRADIEDTARILGVPVPEPIRPEDVTAQ